MLSQGPHALLGLPGTLQSTRPSCTGRCLHVPVCGLGLGEETRALNAVPGPCSALMTRRVLVVASCQGGAGVCVGTPEAES